MKPFSRDKPPNPTSAKRILHFQASGAGFCLSSATKQWLAFGAYCHELTLS